jgi:pyridoxal phosphate enzyme (YggS family)
MEDVRRNIEAVREKIAAYAARAGVRPDSVELVAVSKTMPAERVREAYGAGLRVFGENRVQEFLEKREILAKDIKWNLIGRLQTNKVKYIIDKKIFMLHALDRASLAETLQKQCAAKGVWIDALIQLNLSREETKAGLYAGEVDEFMDLLSGMDRIRLRGVMTIGPNTDDESRVRAVFAQARDIYGRLAAQVRGFDYLSMGMTHDFGWAILEGSNMVRVGAAIFGQRVPVSTA